MRNKSVATEISKRFRSIKLTADKMHTKIDDLVLDAVTKNFEDSKKYNKEYLRQAMAERNSQLSGKVAEIKTASLQKIDAEIAMIRIAISDWMREPLPDNVGAVLSAFRQYGIDVSEGELQGLVELTQGSYIGEKIVCEMAKAKGIDTGFVSYDEIMRQLRTMRGDCKTAVLAYVGQPLDDNTFVSRTANIDLSSGYDPLFFFFASNYFKSDHDSSFSRTQKLLAEQTESEFDILPSKRVELDKLFADCESDEERVDIACSMIESENGINDLLRLYDKDLYSKATTLALDRARERSIRAAEESLNAFREMNTAQKAEKLAEKRLA